MRKIRKKDWSSWMENTWKKVRFCWSAQVLSHSHFFFHTHYCTYSYAYHFLFPPHFFLLTLRIFFCFKLCPPNLIQNSQCILYDLFPSRCFSYFLTLRPLTHTHDSGEASSANTESQTVKVAPVKRVKVANLSMEYLRKQLAPVLQYSRCVTLVWLRYDTLPDSLCGILYFYKY